MENPQQTWQDQIKAHLDLANQVASKMPANEYLETKKLNEILESMEQLRTTFLFQLELQGFKTEAFKKSN